MNIFLHGDHGAVGASYIDVLLDALKDTAIIIPILLAVHLLIELLEVRSFSKLGSSKLLKGKFAPLIATGVGLLPQCGFSVVASDMYAKKYIRIGTLAAVFIATSDEAVPILVSQAITEPGVWLQLLQLVLIKIVMALFIGYMLNFIFRRRELGAAKGGEESTYGCCGHAVIGAPKECEQNPEHHGEPDHSHGAHAHAHSRDHHAHSPDAQAGAVGESKARHVWHTYFKHPICHTLIITAFIFAVNMIFGTLIYFIGEEALASFMESVVWLQPLFAALVGLIPNCASSVLITEMFISGSLTLGAAVSGLAINAGMGFMVLFKENKNIKENVLLMLGLFVYAVAVGYLITAIVR